MTGRSDGLCAILHDYDVEALLEPGQATRVERFPVEVDREEEAQVAVGFERRLGEIESKGKAKPR